jgi:hypothetical protein
MGENHNHNHDHDHDDNKYESGAEALDESKTFDIYHFFSRKDVILAIIAIILLLLIMLAMSIGSEHHLT